MILQGRLNSFQSGLYYNSSLHYPFLSSLQHWIQRPIVLRGHEIPIQ